MLHAKRPLSEVDGNSSKDVPTHSHAKRQNISMRAPLGPTDENAETEIKKPMMVEEEEAYDEMLDYKTINYTTKDNSKLRCLLRDRHLADDGTRQEMIKTLQHSSPNYSSFTTDQLTEMLHNRHLHTITGTKQTKIARLLLNDHLDRHSGNSEEGMLHGSIWGFDIIPISIKRSEGELEAQFASWTDSHLRAHLNEKNLSIRGSKNVLAKRALKAEKEANTRKWEDFMAKKDRLQVELDDAVGHHVNVSEVMRAEERIRYRDQKIRSEARQNTTRIPVCDYDCKNSFYAQISEIDLQVLCLQKGMPGRGHAPKAAMIKWLETGKFEYGDLYVEGLLSICEVRRIPTLSKPLKQDLIDALEELDEREGISGWTQWDEEVGMEMVEVWYGDVED